jgi:multidrug efflux pump subunit AcrA (membrane-fusion protein)
MSAKVSFYTEAIDTAYVNQKPLLVIPSSAIRKSDEKYFVYRIVDNKAKEIEITTGQELGSYIEILSGLNQGEKVINDLNESIKDGVEVKLPD